MNHKKKKNILTTTWMITLFALICAILAGFYFRYQLKNYEQGVLEIYAVQQDSYVQLVLDQINLEKNRKDMEIIRSILGTMDSSSNRFWTMAKNDTLVFVRDVTETSKYHGYTENTYYISDSAQVFINNLNLNHVIHQIVQIGERDYVASGVKFEYNGSNYQICLLTNPGTILDQNAYLGARVNLTIMMGLVLVVFLIMSLTFGLWLEKMNRSKQFIENENVRLRKTIERLNAALNRQEMYDARTAVFQGTVLPLFFEKLSEKGIVPVSIARYTFASQEDKEVFLTGSQMVLGKNYMRFQTSDNALLLIGVLCTKKDITESTKLLDSDGCKMVDCIEIRSDLDSALRKYMRKWNIEED